MNSHYRLASGKALKLEHAALSYQVQRDQVEEPLYIFFRAVNFTDAETGAPSSDSKGCLSLFMEIEFRSIDYECHNDPQLQPNT